jgi:hypothetical protein
MKKIGLMTVVASLVLSLAAFGAEKSGNTAQTGQSKDQTTSTEGKAKAKGKGKAPDAATMEKNLAQLKQEHQAAMKELQDIKKLATDEKATKTIAALDSLMARHEKAYQERIAPIQKRLDTLKAAQKDATEKATKKSKKTGN